MPKGACTLYPGRTHCINCGKCREEEEWIALKSAVSAAIIKSLEAGGCRMGTLEDRMNELCDPARHVR